MADNTTYTPGTGATIAADDVGGVLYERVKVNFGADGSATDVAAGAGLPTTPGYAEQSGSASANNTDLFSIDVRAYRAISFQVYGTFSASVDLQASNDNTTWYAVKFLAVGFVSAQTSISSANLCTATIQYKYLRIRTTSYFSGTVSVIAVLSADPMPTAFLQAGLPTGVTWPIVPGGTMQQEPVAFNGSVSNWGFPGFVYQPDGTTKNWYSARSPSTHKTATATASGNTAVWTPTSGKKFRLMRYIVELTSDSATSGGAAIDVTFQDSSTGMPQGHSIYVPALSGTTLGSWVSGWIDLGNGILSAAANNVLNVNLSAALTAGKVRVTVSGTEE